MDFGMEVGDGQTKTIGYHGNQRFQGFGAEISQWAQVHLNNIYLTLSANVV